MKSAILTMHESFENARIKKLLLVCGIISSCWYVVINVYVPNYYEGYSLLSFTVSELSAIGAPTRGLWIVLVAAYPILFALFGLGVLKSSEGNRLLRAIGWVILFYSVFNIYWPPMHMRGNEPTLTDALHIVWAFATVLLMITMMILAALSFATQFRAYTIASIILHILFGILTSLEAPNIPGNGSTPFIGLWERINIGIFMLWIAVFASMLLKNQSNLAKVRTKR